MVDIEYDAKTHITIGKQYLKRKIINVGNSKAFTLPNEILNVMGKHSDNEVYLQSFIKKDGSNCLIIWFEKEDTYG